MPIKQHLTGNTIETTWTNSGVTPSAIVCAVYTGSGTIIDSGTMSSSGNGHYYYNHTVSDTPGFYVIETLATISGNPYKNRKRIQAIIGEVD